MFVTNKINLKTILCIILILALLFGLYLYGSSNPDTPIIGMLSTRINEKLEVSSENLSDLTSGRSDVASVHMSYYMNQPIWRMFVGMNAASTLETNLDGFKYVGHNEYIDWLLNIGLVGAIVMLYFLLKRTYDAYKTYKTAKDSTDLFLLISKIIWISYAFTLTVYGDLRFMLTLFL